jgi:phage terminase large subunit-like protein
MPSRESAYRNLILNQRVEASSPFVSRSIWKACGGPVAQFDADLPVYAGLDLSEVSDLTAFVLIGCIDGVWHVKPTFWLPEYGLTEKARKDRVPYDLWAREGHLIAAPGRSIEYQYVAGFIRDVFATHNVQKIAFRPLELAAFPAVAGTGRLLRRRT